MSINYFFTADTHFGHKNVIKYNNRPFKNILEMDEELIRRWNLKVRKNDIIYHLGDFCFGSNNFDSYFQQLNGRIILVKGNHDSIAAKNRNKFYEFYDGLCEVKIHGKLFVLCHYAMLTWNKSNYNSWHLYGHSHGMLQNNDHKLTFDCGVDTNNYYPYSFDEVKLIMDKK